MLSLNFTLLEKLNEWSNTILNVGWQESYWDVNAYLTIFSVFISRSYHCNMHHIQNNNVCIKPISSRVMSSIFDTKVKYDIADLI